MNLKDKKRYMMMVTRYGLDDVDIQEEYNAISQKKSNLSSNQRKAVVSLKKCLDEDKIVY